MPEYLLAYDLGTSGNKSTLYTPAGKLVASFTCSYETHYYNGNWAEQGPEQWWHAVTACTHHLLERTGIAPWEIAVVALSGQMMGCVLVDGAGQVLRPSILYCDQRATAQEEQLRARIDPFHFYRAVGHRISASYSLEKLMWVRDCEPEIFARTAKTLCAKDYINFRFTGRMATDYSDASGTNAFDLNTFRWSEEVLDAAGIPVELFPEALESSRILGTLTEQAARETGLLAGTPVAVGGGDGSCAGVGVGSVRPGRVYNCLGSSSWIALTAKEPIIDPGMRTMNWAHCVPGYLHPSGTMQTAGAAQKWMKETLCSPEQMQADCSGGSVYALIDETVRSVPAGARGLLFLPYLLGERTPWWNTEARAAFIGMSLATQREDLLRAVLEGVALHLGIILNIFRGHLAIDEVTLIGGGARSLVWRQILADVFGCPVHCLNVLEEATSMGAAVIGGVAAGVFADFDVIERFVQVQQTVRPDAARQKLYQQRLPIIAEAYQSLTGIYHKLGR